jgi:hypothetical protein
MAKIWTSEDETFLLSNYDAMSNGQLAEHFEVTPKAISHKMRRLRDRMRRERQKRRLELEEVQKLQKKQEVETEIYVEEYCEPLNLPKIANIEKILPVNGTPVNFVSTGFFVKTDAGWEPIMMRKKKLASY